MPSATVKSDRKPIQQVGVWQWHWYPATEGERARGRNFSQHLNVEIESDRFSVSCERLLLSFFGLLCVRYVGWQQQYTSIVLTIVLRASTVEAIVLRASKLLSHWER